MAFSGLSFSVGQVLTASQLNQIDTNVDEIRGQHNGTSAPDELATGVLWLDTTTSGAWVLKLYDNGGDWITLFTIDNVANTAASASSGGEGGTAFGEFLQTNENADGVEFAGPLYGFRNALINGGMQIWQRGTSFTAVSSGDCTADRWLWRQSGGGVVTIDRSTTVPQDNVQYSLHVDVTTADGSIAAGEYYQIEQVIEGTDAARFRSGNSDASEITISFWVYSNVTGTYCVALQNNTNDRRYIAEYSISAASTWEQKTVTLTLDSTGTWETDTDAGIRLIFGLAAGSTYQSTAGSWAAGAEIATANQENFLASTSNDFYLANVQFERGPNRTIFDRRPFSTEWLMCQRYYWKAFRYDKAPVQDGGTSDALYEVGGDAGRTLWDIRVPVPMRIDPHTVTTYNPSTAAATARNLTDGSNSTVTKIFSNTQGAILESTTAADSNDRMAVHVTIDAEFT